MNKVIKIDPYQLFAQGIFAGPLFGSKDVLPFINRFRENYLSTELIRIGGKGDGGYLVPNILDKITSCFSPGVSHTANFEKELSKSYNIKSFMADASVDTAPMADKNFYFEKKFIGSHDKNDFITLGSWIKNCVHGKDNNLLLQMDIEGAEYEVLTYESIENLKRFSCMVVEFHSFNRLFEPFFNKIVSAIFEKIYQEFHICHVHPNNARKIASYDNIQVPEIFEVTFLRKDLSKEIISKQSISLPHSLDEKNVDFFQDITMPEIWWKS